MQITNIKIQRVFDDADRVLKAIVSVTLDNMIAIHDIRVLKTVDKMFIAMPNKSTGEGVYKDVVHPINPECRNMLETAVIAAYGQYIEDNTEKDTAE